MNGVLLGEGSEIALNQGDTIEIRKKRFRIGFPSEEEVEVFKQEEVSFIFQLERIRFRGKGEGRKETEKSSC